MDTATKRISEFTRISQGSENVVHRLVECDAIETCECVTWCFSDRASLIDYVLITNFDALIIIYS